MSDEPRHVLAGVPHWTAENLQDAVETMLLYSSATSPASVK
ncbi:MAG: hypothetical protein ACRD3T_18675 [Terriglobia bacterium]